MKKKIGSFALVQIMVAVLAGWAAQGHAMPVLSLDIDEGSVAYNGRFHRTLDRLIDQDGVVKMGEYQPIGDIVPSITKSRATFSLFTSGFNGAPPPSATIDGSSIVADLSSLFFAVSRGDSMQLWSIGGQATGAFDPETWRFTLTWKDPVPRAFGGRHSDFRSSWEHFREDLIGGDVREGDDKAGWYGKDKWRHGRSREATFMLEGTATPVPTPASLALYAGGLFGLGSWVWFTRRRVGVA